MLKIHHMGRRVGRIGLLSAIATAPVAGQSARQAASLENPVTLSAAERAVYVGAYTFRFTAHGEQRSFVINVADEGGRLVGWVDPKPKSVLIPLGNHTFGMKESPQSRIIFTVEGGRVTRALDIEPDESGVLARIEGTPNDPHAQAISGSAVTVTTILPREREIELATSAAPADIGASATVYVYTSKGYEKARDGTNGFTCLVNRDSELDGYHMFKPTCWDAHGSATIVPAILEFAKMIASGQTVADVTSALRQQLKDGTLKPFEKVGIAYMLQGDVSHYDAATGTIQQRAFPPHVMIYAPTITWNDLAMSGRAANADERAAIIYQSALGYRYLVVRVPRTDGR